MYIYHHHQVVPLAWISLTLSRHSSLSFIALGGCSGQHCVSSHSCWMYVRAGRPAFARPCVGVHKSTSLMSSSLFLQQCPACLVRLTWMVFVIGGRWPYSWCLVGCCRQDLLKIARSKCQMLRIYIYIYIYICICMYIHHHHHHVVPLAWISLTLSRHFSLSFIASGWSSGLHLVSSHSYVCMFVLVVLLCLAICGGP